MIPTPHIEAKKGDIAKTVLMPGDPLRAQFIAENFLTDVKKFNSVRNMFGFTGKYKDKEVSVMGSGMGCPSMGIYSYELFNFYDVDRIIRVGSAGAYDKDLDLFDIVIGMGASTNSTYANQFNLNGNYSALADFHLVKNAYKKAKEFAPNRQVKVGNIFSSDIFYEQDPEMWKKWSKLGVLAVEMEAYALYSNAALAGKEALTILTISDSFHFDKITTAEEREQSFTQMMEIALEIS